MTTETNVERWRKAHHDALWRLAGRPARKTGLQLWRALRRIERQATQATTAYCNGEISSETCDEACEAARLAVERVMGRVPAGFFVNRDPRGCALKIDNEVVEIPDGLHRDLGGYGCLAATIDGD